MYDVQDERDEFFPMMVKHRTRTFEEVRKSAVTKWARFPYLARLVQIVATLPVNTAECEHGFSAQNRIKTTLRNQLTTDSLDDLLYIDLLGPSLEKFDAQASITAWQTGAKGSRHIHGHAVGSGRKRKRSDNSSSSSSDSGPD